MAKVVDTHGSEAKEWVGFDLDGTLAKYDGWKGVEHIGEPVPAMVVLAYIIHRLTDKDVKIFTARVAPREGDDGSKARKYIEKWCKKNLGFVPEITCVKDASMICCIDDRACAVDQNTGRVVGGDLTEVLAKQAQELKDGSLADVRTIFSQLSGQDRRYVAPNHPEFYGSAQPLSRTVAFDNGNPIGFCDLFDEELWLGDRGKRRASIEIAVLEAARGKGLSKALAIASIKKAMRTGRVDHIDWNVVHGNTNSAKAAKSLGFKSRGWWRWHPRFTMSATHASSL